jgi:hypothetical protein
MIFTETSPETNQTVWGCPRFSRAGAGWLIDWYGMDAICEGASVARGEALEWILANPESVETMINQCAAWKGRMGQIPY